MSSTNPSPSPSSQPGANRPVPWAVRAGILVLLLAGAYAAKSCGLLETAPEPGAPPPPTRTSPPPRASLETRISDVTIRDLEGKVVLRGDVDLSKTLERIQRNERLAFRNDGAAFANRESRLPRRANGYYREWVHPTDGLPGPGPQRVVTGEGGEIYYTHDHYKSFRKLR